MAITTYTPQLQVRLIKLVGRRNGVSERHAAAQRDLDLLHYLGDHGDAGTVTTSKNLTEAGTFTVSFADRSRRGLDTVYALVEPMDLIEIRAARVPTGGSLPLIMRGFVDQVQRKESLGKDGEPIRTVVITGHDSGKLLEMSQVFYEIAPVAEKNFLSDFMLRADSGMALKIMKVGEFMNEIVDKVVNPRARKLFAVSSQAVGEFKLYSSVEEGSLTPSMMTSKENKNQPLWKVMEAYADRPWNELFVEDEDRGPAIRFRPVPYKTVGGHFIMPGAIDPGTVAIEDRDVVSWEARRGDKRIANWYWVSPERALMETNGALNQQSTRTRKHLDFEHPNSREDLYGAKKMEFFSHLIPDITRHPTTAPPAERQQILSKYVDWFHTRAERLKEMNRDNSAFEECTATLKGSEALKVGRFLRLTRGELVSELVSEGYVTKVTHEFKPLRTWTTAVELERCTGFLERSKLTSNPYWKQGIRGPYT
ncbi:hypothetical protein [Azospirillum sp. TSO22-1]|uniref:hypothetical protein n=1 Tax=Azospirillum sp. TSO22-1 TaxID=716789 RepID=UPI0011B5300C|nr:hypothetical protein [Azospirillum sp. TSO22-1]